MANIFLRKTLSVFVQYRFFTSSIKHSGRNRDAPPLHLVVEYLTKSCGVPLESAHSIAPKIRKINLEDTRKLDSVIDYLKSCGLETAQIAKLVRKSPRILFSNVEKTIGPKIEYFNEVGLPKDLVLDMIVRNPQMFKRNLSYIKPGFEFLMSYLGNVDAVAAALWRSSRLLLVDVKDSFQNNVDVMTSEGVPVEIISRMIILQPRVLLHSTDWMVRVIRFVKDLFDPKAPMFVHGVRVMASMSESGWNKKIALFRSLGWAETDILRMFKREPQCFVTSEEKLRRAVDFFVNTVKMDVKDLVSRPKLMLYGIDKRLRPRYNVIEALVSKNLLPKNKSIPTILESTEKKFAEDYVIKYLNKVPEMTNILKGAVVVEKTTRCSQKG